MESGYSDALVKWTSIFRNHRFLIIIGGFFMFLIAHAHMIEIWMTDLVANMNPILLEGREIIVEFYRYYSKRKKVVTSCQPFSVVGNVVTIQCKVGLF
jgi:hypothetical protein